jgi:copper(I)-binding protein
MIGSALCRAFLLLPLIMAMPAFVGSLAAREATLVATPVTQTLNETPGNVPVSMLVRNVGSLDDVLLGASSPIADRVELHHSPLVAGVRVMEPLNEGVIIPAGSMTIFEPESDHLMLIGTRQPLVQGDRFPITLRFQRAGEVSVTGRVRRKVDAAGVTPIPPVTAGDLEISLVSAPPAPDGRQP